MSFIDAPGSLAGANAPVRELSLTPLLALLDQLRSCRRGLETDVNLGSNGDDAICYLVAAEMHVKAARMRLEAEICERREWLCARNRKVEGGGGVQPHA